MTGPDDDCGDSAANREPAVCVQHGLAAADGDRAAAIYDAAFGEKFALAIRHPERRREILKMSFRPEFVFTATQKGRLVGLAGFQTPRGAWTSGMTYRLLVSHLGFWRGHRAAVVLALYERKPKDGELVMDGIAVDGAYRGRGIGTRLLSQIIDYARQEGFRSVRLDVIDTNPAARRPYERRGFSATHTETFEWLRWLFGFGSVTTMTFSIDP